MKRVFRDYGYILRLYKSESIEIQVILTGYKLIEDEILIIYFGIDLPKIPRNNRLS
jgi:hypothetical protein